MSCWNPDILWLCKNCLICVFLQRWSVSSLNVSVRPKCPWRQMKHRESCNSEAIFFLSLSLRPADQSINTLIEGCCRPIEDVCMEHEWLLESICMVRTSSVTAHRDWFLSYEKENRGETTGGSWITSSICRANDVVDKSDFTSMLLPLDEEETFPLSPERLSTHQPLDSSSRG